MNQIFEAQHPRNPRGEFVDKNAPESSRVRLQQIADGYAEAMVADAAAPVDTTRNIDGWWARAFATGEYSTGETVPHMPDDWTPNMTGGNAISGHRRTYRRRYQVAGRDFRMPSKSAIHSYMESHNLSVLDVPISVATSGGDKQQFVRVYRGRNGSFDVRALGNGPESLLVGESVAAVLENRALMYRSSQDLIDQRHARDLVAGVQVDRNIHRSSFLTGASYDHDTGVITVAMGDHAYQYEGSEETYAKIRDSRAPGITYNQLIKAKQGSFVKLSRCPNCGRYASDSGHECPTPVKTSNDVASFEQRMEILGHSVSMRKNGTYSPLKAWSIPSTGRSTGWTRGIVGSQLAPLATRFDSTTLTMSFSGLSGNNAAIVEKAIPAGDTYTDVLTAAQIPGVGVEGTVSAPATGNERLTVTGLTIRSTAPNGLVNAYRNAKNRNQRAYVIRKMLNKLQLHRPVTSMQMDRDGVIHLGF